MKKLETNYTFNKTAKTVTLNDYSTINHAGLLVITNVTDGIIIYNFASSTLGGVVTDNYVTLTYDTSSMSDSDELQIWYDDGILTSTKEDDDKLNLIIRLLLQKANESPVWLDVVNNALRTTNVTSQAVTISSGTVTTVTTVGTVTNQANIGGYPADMVTLNLTETDWALTTRNLLSFTP